MDTPATSRKHPAFSLLNAEARQPTASVGSISTLRSATFALGLHSPPTNNIGVMLYRKGGRNRERNCRIPRISPPPPPAVCTKAKVAKKGAYLWDTTVYLIPTLFKVFWSNFCVGVYCFIVATTEIFFTSRRF